MTFTWKGRTWGEETRSGQGIFVSDFNASNVDEPDSSGYVTMRLTNPDNAPVGCEIHTPSSGYGTYTIVIEGNWSQMSKQIVFGGMFTYASSAPGANEMDVDEISAWGRPQSPAMSHTLWHANGKSSGQEFIPPDGVSTHRLIWAPGKAIMQSYAGSGTNGTLLRETIFTNGSPAGTVVATPATKESILVNLWAGNFYNNVENSGLGVKPFTAKVRDFAYAAPFPSPTEE